MATSSKRQLRISDALAALTLAADAGTGLPPETGLKVTLLALNLLEIYGVEQPVLRETFYAGLVRHAGCSSTSLEENRLSGDDIELRGAMLPCDPADILSLAGHALRGLGRGKGLIGRAQSFGQFLLTAPLTARGIFAAQCEVATRFAKRLDLDDGVQATIEQVDERFDGKGIPNGVSGSSLRIAGAALKLAEIATLCLQIGGLTVAVETVNKRAGGQIDPTLASVFVQHARELAESIVGTTAWDTLLDREVEPKQRVTPQRLFDVALVFADFADLKSPYTLAHSRRVAERCHLAGLVLGINDAALERIRLAALLHDIGRVAVPNAIWDKPGPLTEGEWACVRDHAYHSERILRCSQIWRPYARLAASHHERADGSGYHKALPPGAQSLEMGLLQVSDVYEALLQPRAHRDAHSASDAAAILREHATRGHLASRAVSAVLDTVGERSARTAYPCGLSKREVEVLALVARGLSNKAIASQLFISPRTVQRHTSNIYNKIGVGSRAAAALFASENGLA